jgi:membrane protein
MHATQPMHRKKFITHAFAKYRERVPLGLASTWDILQNAVRNYQYNGNTNQAAAISLYAILSFIPLFILTILVVSSVFGSYPDAQRELLKIIREFNPYFSDTILRQLGHIEQKRRVLGWIGIISLVWFAAMIFGAIETAMNVIFRSRKKRNYLVSKSLAIAMIPLGWTVGVASFVITYVVTLLAKHPLLTEQGVFILSFVNSMLFRFVLPYCLIVVFFTIVYKVIPTERISWGNAFAGAAIFSALMEIAKHFFTWYVSNFTQYNVIFGSLGAVVILVLWVFYIALILLFCAELIASYRRRDLILLEKAFLKPDGIQLKIDERLSRKFGRIYPKGSYIFREGDTNQEMYFILAGHVRVEKKAGRVKKVLAEMEPGAYFGEMAALINAPRAASAQATKDTRLAVIDGITFHNLIRESEEVSLVMLREFSQRIIQTNMALEELNQSWTKMAVIIYLMIEWPLREDREPLGDISNYTRKEKGEIQQVIEELDEQRVLRLSGGRIIEFSKDRAWDMVVGKIFFPDRRSAKRQAEIQATFSNSPKT